MSDPYRWFAQRQSDTAVAAVRDRTIDATLRAVTMPGKQLPREVG